VQRGIREILLALEGRIRIRLGTPFVLEANANPNLEREEDFADAALHDAIPYPALLQRLISYGRSYRAEWRED